MKNNPNITNFNFKKGYGQNFIFDHNLLESIADDANVAKDDQVLEIGAGAGTLTEVLCKRCQKVVSYEIDQQLIKTLKKISESHANLTFVFEDFMSISNDIILSHFDKKFKVVANIPYYITTPIIFKLLEMIDHIESITIMVQKEVAERICSISNSDNSVLTYSILARCDAEIKRVVPKQKFTPSPKVDSAILTLLPHNNKYHITDYDGLIEFIKVCFTARRKTLANNLTSGFGIEKQEAEKILTSLFNRPNIRPQELGVADFISLKNVIKK